MPTYGEMMSRGWQVIVAISEGPEQCDSTYTFKVSTTGDQVGIYTYLYFSGDLVKMCALVAILQRNVH